MFFFNHCNFGEHEYCYSNTICLDVFDVCDYVYISSGQSTKKESVKDYTNNAFPYAISFYSIFS